MEVKVDINGVYAPSEDVVSREIEGELLIVPLVSGMGDMEDELFTLNESAKLIWKRLDGQKALKEVALELLEDYEAPAGEIESDVMGLVEELLKRGMLVEVSNP